MAKMTLSGMTARAYLNSRMPLFSGDEQLDSAWAGGAQEDQSMNVRWQGID
jgi:hypothetical protein